MYKVESATTYTVEGKKIVNYQILRNHMPVFRANCFLEKKGKKSETTAKQYAYRLCSFLSFLENKRNKKYKQASKLDVVKFIDSILFESDGLLYIEKGRACYNTLSHYLAVIKGFYRYLEDELNENAESVSDGRRRSAKYSYLYGQIWDMDTSLVLDAKVERVKGSKEYIKWYTDEEIEAIKSNFKTLRDSAIFSLSLDGMRIDEILSLRTSDFDPNENCVYPYRSKGKETGNVGSSVTISTETSKTINDYIFNERDEVIIKLQEDGKYDFPDELFLNLREDEYMGQPLGYRNVISILKGVANKAGLNPKMIRTHSGRSTKTMELLDYQAEHPEDNITDEQIREIMRWTHPSSIYPYINTKDRRISVKTAKKIAESKNKNKKRTQES